MTNIIVNGDFATDLSGWTLTNSSFLEQGSYLGNHCGFFPSRLNFCAIHQHVDGTAITTLYFKIRRTADTSACTLKVYCDTTLLATYNAGDISSSSWDSKSLPVSSINTNASIKFQVDAGDDTAVYIYVTDISSEAAVTPPTASFTQDKTYGLAPLTVNFTDTSTGSPYSFYWNFDDGQASADQNPSHEFTTSGTYHVTLEATNSGGSDTSDPTTIEAYLSTTPISLVGIQDIIGLSHEIGLIGLQDISGLTHQINLKGISVASHGVASTFRCDIR